ncbi:MAG: hypothetical protein AAB479_01560 [Patescibacteria group bacterium]
MTKFFQKIGLLILGATIATGYFVFVKESPENNQSVTANILQSTPSVSPEGDIKIFVFNNLHGEEVIGGGFEFRYPAHWHNNGHYFSPQKIKYYDMVSVDAPVYFDLISKDLFETSDLKYQITTNKRRSPDSTVKIDGKTFRKYDLIDYGSAGGESTGRIIIYLGPQVSFNDDSYYLAFRWEERPLTIPVPGNDIEVFDNMLLTLKFF